jgi:excisionase family DNA binding protein
MDHRHVALFLVDQMADRRRGGDLLLGTHFARLVFLKEAAMYAQVSVATLRGWIRRGILPVHRLGPKLIRIDLDELDRVLNGEFDELAAHRSIPLHERYLFDVEIAGQRLKEYGPPWQYATLASEVVHLTTELLIERGVTVCGVDLSRAMVSFETNLDGKQATCPVCRARPTIIEMFLRAAGVEQHVIYGFGFD